MAKRKYHIGISGSYGGLNLGDEAILQCIIQELRNTLPVAITVFSRNANDTLARHHVDKAVDVRKFSLNEIRPEIEKLDLFVLGGGGILYDADVKDYLREAIIAREMNIPVMTYAIGAGPLKDPAMQALVKDTLETVNVITVRERNAQRLLEGIGIKKEIIVTADPALLLKPEPVPENVLATEGIEGRKLVGISVREPGAAAPDLDEKVYHALLANAADFIVDRLDADVVFIPLERHSLDLQHSHSVVSLMLKPQRATILKGDYTSGQLLTIMSRLHFAVGMRLHFLIFAALQKVPFVALPYASKVEGFLEALEFPMPPIQLVNAGRLIAHIDFYWDIKSQLKKRISNKLPELKKKAQETNRILVRLINETYDEAF